MALSDADVQRQIRHMMAFIEQEANEKAEEIDAKAEEEFNIEKGRLVQHHRLKIMEFYEKKEKQVEMKRKIDFSHMQNQARLKILKVREDLVKNVLEEARKVLAELPKDESRYKNILQLLILQGVMQLLEPYVVIKTRAVDQKIAESVLPDVVKQYKEKTGKDVKLKVDPDSVLSPSVAGGVELNAQNGRIKISNTLEDRLQLVAYQLIPQIRMSLFGRSESRKFIN